MLHIGSAQTKYQLRTAGEPYRRCRKNIGRRQIAMNNVGPHAAKQQYKSSKRMQQIPSATLLKMMDRDACRRQLTLQWAAGIEQYYVDIMSTRGECFRKHNELSLCASEAEGTGEE